MDSQVTRYHFLTENISDVIWAYDIEHRRVTYVSKSVQIKLGFTPGEILNGDLELWMPPESVQQVEKILFAGPESTLGSQSAEEPIVEAFELFHKDGSRVWTDLIYTYSKNPETGRVELIGTSRDITRLVKAEREADRVKELMEGAAEMARIGVWEHLVMENRWIVSNQWFEIHGLKEDEFERSYDQILKLIHPDDRVYLEEIMEKAFRTKETYPVRYRIIRHDTGEVRYVRARARFIFDSEGEISSSRGYVQDITSRIEATEQLRLSEERFRGTFEHSTNGIALVGLDGDWIKVNRSLCEMLGYSEEELTSMTFQDITHPEDLEPDLALLRELTDKKRESYQLEKRYIHKNGEIVWVILGVSMVCDKDGKPLHYVSQITNVTEFKKSELQNVVLIQEIHHRVKNNLAIIAGLLELEVMTSDDKTVTEPLMKSVSRISSIAHVHELLYNTQNLTTIDLSEYLDKLIVGIRDALKSSVDVSIDSDFNNISMNVNEAIPLGILFNELVTNSFKHAFKGRSKGKITIRAREKGGRYLISYSDNGNGFDSGILKKDEPLGFKIIYTILDQLQAERILQAEEGFRLEFDFKPRFRGAHSNLQGEGTFGSF